MHPSFAYYQHAQIPEESQHQCGQFHLWVIIIIIIIAVVAAQECPFSATYCVEHKLA
jgi:hypothetical protein